MISVHGLTKQYHDFRRGTVTALDTVSFSVRRGEIFGLLGPNGAGKTTCLRILSTVLQPTSGDAVLAGSSVVRNPAEVRQKIGFMSCNTANYDRMTAWEMVEYFGLMYGMEPRALQVRIDSVFSTLQMHDFRDTPVGKMSTGMKQKVSIARSIVHDPQVLIFDEPTAGLDLLVARALLQQISALRDQGKSIIFSTHIMREVERVCDRIAVINKGRILATGTLAELQSDFGTTNMDELFLDLVSEPATSAV